MKLVLAARETTTLGGGQKIISEIDEKRPQSGILGDFLKT